MAFERERRLFAPRRSRLGRERQDYQEKRAPKAPGVQGAYGKLVVVSGLAVLGGVKPFAFLFFRHAQADDEVHELEGDEGNDR